MIMRNTLPKLRHLLPCAAGLLAFAGVSADAQTFGYTNCDLIAGFRISGGSSDLVVDLGPVGTYEEMSTHTTVELTQFTSDQINDALPTLNGISWAVMAAQRGNANYPDDPLQTLWITSPWLTPTSPGVTWKCQSKWTQGGPASQIEAIGSGATLYANAQPAGTDNTDTAIVIASSSQYSFTGLMGSYGDLSGTFQGNVENTTSDDFDSADIVSRSVLLKLTPSSDGGAGTVVGYFDFKPDGTLWFTAGPPPQATTIDRIRIDGNTVRIWFPTVNQGYYRIRYCDGTLVPDFSTWTIGANLVGTGETLSIQDTLSTTCRYYVIEAY